MPGNEKNGLNWYRTLLKLYPKSYRQAYENEMLTTLEKMFAEAESPTAKRQIYYRTIKDYFLSLTQQSLWATEHSFNIAPDYVKRETAVGASLVAPFFLIFIYNIVSLAAHHTVALVHVESRTWVIYSIVLPSIALLLSMKTCFSGIYGQLMRKEWRGAFHTIFKDWHFLGFVVAYLALIAIF